MSSNSSSETYYVILSKLHNFPELQYKQALSTL